MLFPYLQKILVRQKRVLRLMYFSEPRAHAMPLFTSSKSFLKMLYVETVSSITFDVSCQTVPTNISYLFTKANEKHNHETRFSSSCNFYVNWSKLNQNHGSFANKFGAKLWNSICDKFRQLPKRAFKNHINDMLFSLLEAEDDYVESPILLQKIHNYRANTEFNL